jgi:hypothetical protein
MQGAPEVVQAEQIQYGGVPLGRGASLFPGGWRASWGQIGMADNPAQARIVTPSNPQKASGGMMAMIGFPGNRKIPTPGSIPAPLPGPHITGEQNSPPWWEPSQYWSVPAPLFARHTRVFSDHPLPVPALQAWSSVPVAQRASRIGGRTATGWPSPNTNWPVFGPGGT